MDKDKQKARQARYRAKKARLELMVSEELKEQFRTLPGLDGASNADKLQALCETWIESYQAENEHIPVDDDDNKQETLPGFSNKDLAALSKAVNDMDYKYSREAFQDAGLADNKDKLAFYLNKRARDIYAASEHATEAKTAGRHERANKVIEASDALTEIKKGYRGAVAGVIALDLVHLDLNFWRTKSDQDKRLAIWRAFQTWDSQ